MEAAKKGVSVERFLYRVARTKAHRVIRKQRTKNAQVATSMARTRDKTLADLDQLFAECDEITRGHISSTSAADLIREAREERHRDVEGHGSS